MHMETTTNDLMANSRLTFDDQVITKITALCAHEVDGILGMDGNVMDTIADTFTKGDNTAVSSLPAASFSSLDR